MNAILLMTGLSLTGSGSGAGYFVGALIAACVLGYLIYTLIKPEKF